MPNAAKKKARFLFVGSGALEDEMKNFISQNDLERSATICGFYKGDAIASLYAIAHVIVLPSSLDPSPKVINEAMNFGVIPVVSDRVGTANDLVSHDENGFVFPYGNVNEISQILTRLVLDPDLRGRLKCARV